MILVTSKALADGENLTIFTPAIAGSFLHSIDIGPNPFTESADERKKHNEDMAQLDKELAAANPSYIPPSSTLEKALIVDLPTMMVSLEPDSALSEEERTRKKKLLSALHDFRPIWSEGDKVLFEISPTLATDEIASLFDKDATHGLKAAILKEFGSRHAQYEKKIDSQLTQWKEDTKSRHATTQLTGEQVSAWARKVGIAWGDAASLPEDSAVLKRWQPEPSHPDNEHEKAIVARLRLANKVTAASIVQAAIDTYPRPTERARTRQENENRVAERLIAIMEMARDKPQDKTRVKSAKR